ncbi:hypothetical protein DPEC_G00003610 [Dallia pectoralis]|uniref:Uncharacterized protein n=1 Tax=Dallia pectoralis TaxID=75939 RepID=A0ACC2HJG1_DALPE|nr:hypothetical protein DPEC_G00003610 [Dallia pectoralis]
MRNIDGGKRVKLIVHGVQLLCDVIKDQMIGDPARTSTRTRRICHCAHVKLGSAKRMSPSSAGSKIKAFASDSFN